MGVKWKQMTVEEKLEKGYRSGQRRAQFIHSRHLGRPTKESETLLNDYPDVIRAYHNGLSLRKASAETGRAINTVRKVYDVINAKVGRK